MESYENPEDIWVSIIMPEDEDRELELRDVAAEISTDILLAYGYSIMISSALRKEKIAA